MKSLFVDCDLCANYTNLVRRGPAVLSLNLSATIGCDRLILLHKLGKVGVTLFLNLFGQSTNDDSVVQLSDQIVGGQKFKV